MRGKENVSHPSIYSMLGRMRKEVGYRDAYEADKFREYEDA